VTFWDLMTALCSVMPLAGALATMRDANRGLRGYGLALVAGVMAGVLCAWLMRSAGTAVIGRLGTGPDRRRWNFRLLYAGALAWIVLSLFIGSWVATLMIHHI
jgi:hypothetical protein